jgi:MFS family permease
MVTTSYTKEFGSYKMIFLNPWFKLFHHYRRYLLFALLHNFFGGFGQTYLLAFFIGSFQKDFALSYTEIGLLSMYMSLGSAFTLPYFGRMLDKIHAGTYSLIAALCLSCGCLLVAFSQSIYYLFFGLYLIRFSAHGLMPHISDVTISRYFIKNRGKALAISSTGGSLGEAFLPLIIVQLLIFYDWRQVYGIMALVVVIILLPTTSFLIKRKDSFHYPPEGEDVAETSELKSLSCKKLFSSSYFTSALLMVMIPPFLMTGFLFYQNALAEFKGWEMEVMGGFMVGFAIFRVIFGILAGALTDRFSAQKLFPFYILPIAIGILMVLFVQSSLGTLCFFCLAGATLGLGSNFKAAIWAERYGRKKVAMIRSISTSAMVLSTALSPPLFGFILDAGYPFSVIMQGSIALVLLASGTHYFIYKRKGTRSESVIDQGARNPII